MKWIWVRHGMTDKNKQGVYMGHTDAPLNDRGCDQMQNLQSRVEELFSSDSIAAIYSSDLIRCLGTAEMLGSSFGIKPKPVHALRELNFGQWEGRTYEQLLESSPQKLQHWVGNPYNIAPPNGETLWELGRRVDDFLQAVLKAGKCSNEPVSQPVQGNNIIFVSHGGPIRWFQSKWIKGDPYLFWQMKGAGHGQAFVTEWNGSDLIDVGIL